MRLRIEADETFLTAYVRGWYEGVEERFEMTRRANAFEAELTMPESAHVFWYYFILQDEAGRTLLYGNANDSLGGEGAVYTREPPSYQITLYDPAYETPDWMHESALYQIFPDRFFSSCKKDAKNCLYPGCWYHDSWTDDPEIHFDEKQRAAADFFGGDLRGITQKLAYIKSLGVGAIYLNPIFRARSNHKYDTGCYMEVDPSFGTEEDLQILCSEAQQMGIRVILDGVFSHTGDDSIYFDRYNRHGGDGAYQKKNSPYSSWYRFEKWPEQYESWWGFDSLPNVNETDPSYMRYILSGEDAVVSHWLHEGTSGWRLDVADELPMDFLRRLRRRVKKEKSDACIIGEVWEDASRKETYGELRNYCSGDTLDGCMNYPVRDAIIGFLLGQIDAYGFERALESQRENYPPQFLYACMNLLGSHDKPRAISVLSGLPGLEAPPEKRCPLQLSKEQYALGRERYVAALRLLSALPGMPSVYYGDEAGLVGMADPFCRGTYPWGYEDKALIREVQDILCGRPGVCRTGFSAARALNKDMAVVARWYEGGRDVFGKAQKGPENALCVVNRADTQQQAILLPGDIDGFPLRRPLALHIPPRTTEIFTL
ncbi:MAG: glycoside hydrolase family 13 protein [Eubacteriales bacterium]|nr:glycoside hydrolase family 13 protein [Eubacteriales bacterium]